MLHGRIVYLLCYLIYACVSFARSYLLITIIFSFPSGKHYKNSKTYRKLKTKREQRVAALFHVYSCNAYFLWYSVKVYFCYSYFYSLLRFVFRGRGGGGEGGVGGGGMPSVIFTGRVVVSLYIVLYVK